MYASYTKPKKFAHCLPNGTHPNRSLASTATQPAALLSRQELRRLVLEMVD